MPICVALYERNYITMEDREKMRELAFWVLAEHPKFHEVYYEDFSAVVRRFSKTAEEKQWLELVEYQKEVGKLIDEDKMEEAYQKMVRKVVEMTELVDPDLTLYSLRGLDCYLGAKRGTTVSPSKPLLS